MRAAAIAESKGWEKALRRVTRGGAVSTPWGVGTPSNMRDCVATLEIDSTRSLRVGQKAEKKRTGQRPVRGQTEEDLRLPFASRSRCVGVLLVKAFHAARRVDKFLLAREERVAVRADFDAQHIALGGRAGLERMPTSAVHSHSMIIGMNTGFHDSPFSFVSGLHGSPGSQGSTAASLGHEASLNYKPNWEQRKTGSVDAVDALYVRLATLVPCQSGGCR